MLVSKTDIVEIDIALLLSSGPKLPMFDSRNDATLYLNDWFLTRYAKAWTAIVLECTE
jgi:hypothetical protein